jgi:hypothetical protein
MQAHVKAAGSARAHRRRGQRHGRRARRDRGPLRNRHTGWYRVVRRHGRGRIRRGGIGRKAPLSASAAASRRQRGQYQDAQSEYRSHGTPCLWEATADATLREGGGQYVIPAPESRSLRARACTRRGSAADELCLIGGPWEKPRRVGRLLPPAPRPLYCHCLDNCCLNEYCALDEYAPSYPPPLRFPRARNVS